MEKGLLFLTLSVLCLWAILDDFFGDKRVSKIAQQLTPNAPSLGEMVDDKVDKVKEKVEKSWDNKEKADKNKKKAKKKIDKDKTLNKKEKKTFKSWVDHIFEGSEVF